MEAKRAVSAPSPPSPVFAQPDAPLASTEIAISRDRGRRHKAGPVRLPWMRHPWQ
jgi:hypothetical protein